MLLPAVSVCQSAFPSIPMTKAVQPRRALRPEKSQSQQHAKNKEATIEDSHLRTKSHPGCARSQGSGEETALTDAE